MEVYTTEKHRLKRNSAIYKLIDHLCFLSKNLYNYALYKERQFFFQNKQFIPYSTLYQYIKNSVDFKALPSVLSQQTLKKLCQNLTGFTKATKDYKNNPTKYLGKPKLPKYLPKLTGRFPLIFPNNACRLKEGAIHFHKILEGFTLKTKLNSIQQVQFIKRGNDYWVYITGIQEIQVQQNSNLKYIAGLDLGIDNFSTISVWSNNTRPIIINGKGLKSYNKEFNRKLSHLKSELDRHNKNKPEKERQRTSKRIQNLYQKRSRYLDTFTHQVSRYIVNHLLKSNVKQLIIGYNQKWKQNSPLSKRVNQTFIQIPYLEFINKLKYKAERVGIQIILTEESYTSGTSFLDNEQPIKENYNKERRIHRGLFQSNIGYTINADVNSSYQIMKKVYPDLKIGKANKQLYQFLIPIRVNVG